MALFSTSLRVVSDALTVDLDPEMCTCGKCTKQIIQQNVNEISAYFSHKNQPLQKWRLTAISFAHPWTPTGEAFCVTKTPSRRMPATNFLNYANGG